MTLQELRITAKATKLSEPVAIITDSAERAAHYIKLLRRSGHWREIRVNGQVFHEH